jgi:riboflavin kinase/FMN adenylyltransferase
MDVVAGVDGLEPSHGPIFAVIGVFDGLHRGHAYLLEHLVREAAARAAKSCVITFDHHPDEVLTGSAPPLLLDPTERLERLASAGIDVTVVQHFDETVRHIPYDRFIAMIRDRTELAGLLMTPDAAFGFERRGTPDAVAALGRSSGFDVVVVPTLILEGAPIRSSDIRKANAQGHLAAAERLLGRPVALRGRVAAGTITFDWPMALPPAGAYDARVDGRPTRVEIDGGTVRADGAPDGDDVEVVWNG